MVDSADVLESTELLSALVGDGVPLIDTRDAEAYSSAHITGASSFPLSELRLRSGELPPPTGLRIILMAEPGTQMSNSLEYFAPNNRARAGWIVHEAILATPGLWKAARLLNLIETGPTSRQLWLPSPHLTRTVSQLEELVAPRGRRAIDLGCGKGRDCIWLAQRGWQVVGVDNQQCFLTHLRDFAARQGLGDSVQPVLIDLRREFNSQSLIALLRPPLALVNVSRFMHRGLLDALVRHMPAGCCLAVHHFLVGSVSLKSGRPIKEGNPDERSLDPGELRERLAVHLPHAHFRVEIVMGSGECATQSRRGIGSTPPPSCPLASVTLQLDRPPAGTPR